MKKVIAIMLSVLFAALMAVPAFAATEEKSVYVTVSNGKIAEALVKVDYKDADGDGKITIDDALRLAHDAAYKGGSAAGYGSANTDYGLSLTKLWGVENGGGYGYYVNDGMAMSLADEIKAGDHVYAFVYTDLKGWSDTYSYFDKYTATVKKGDSIELTLSKIGYDESWNTVALPLDGAELTVDGEKTGVKTDANGKATFKPGKSGTLTVSAVKDGVTLVPPVCVVEVPSNITTTVIIICAAIAVVVIIGAVVLAKSKKK